MRQVSPELHSIHPSELRAGREAWKSHSHSSRGLCGHRLHRPGPRVTVFPRALRVGRRGVRALSSFWLEWGDQVRRGCPICTPGCRAALTASRGLWVSGGGAPTLSVPASWPWLGRLYEQPALPLPRSLLWSQRQGFIAPRGQRLCGSPSALAALFLGLGRPSALQKASPSVVFLVLAEGSSGACGGRAPGVPETFPAFGAESPWDWSTRVKFWAEASGFNSIISCR